MLGLVFGLVGLCRAQQGEGVAYDILALSKSDEDFKGRLLEAGLLHEQENACQGGIDGNFIGAAMERGYFRTILNLVRACVERDIKVDIGIHQKASYIRRKISEVTGLLQSAKMQQASVVAPAFEWAQNGDSLFLGVKFAHKLDAPACIDLIDKNVEILETGVRLSATCKGKNKKFLLELDLFDAIDKENSSWNMASVGRGTFTLSKAKAQTPWVRLLKSHGKPRNMHTWWHLHEKYADELKELAKKNEEKIDAETSSQQDTDSVPKQEPEQQKKNEVEVEKTEKEKEDDSKRKELRRRAKADTKRVNKQYKKKLKSLDAENEQRVKQLKEEQQKALEVLETSNKKLRDELIAEKKTKQKEIEETLKEAIKLIDSPEQTGGAVFGFYDKMRTMLFGQEDTGGDDEKEL